MAIKKVPGRQAPLVAVLTINFSDPTAYGTAENAIDLPVGAIVTSGDIVIVTPFNGTTNTISLGDVTLGTRYASAVDLKAAAGTRTALTVTGFATTTTEPSVRALLAQTGTASAGAVRVHLTYYVPGREFSAQG